MKKANTHSVKKTIHSSAVHKKRAQLRRTRPLHKRMLLHPFSVMVLLCAGVLMVGMTIQGFADSYQVTATVPAPRITRAAVIAAPSNLLHVNAAFVTVTGTCQAQSYVTLQVNAAFGGSSPCGTNQTFSLPATLSAGANELKAQIYNLTDVPGPASTTTLVYLDQTALAPPAPSSPPTGLHLANVEGARYTSNGGVWQTSVNPTISGMAPPFARIVVTFHSVVQTCYTQADATGWWSCTLDDPLPAGIHHVDVLATTPSGQKLTLPTFEIKVLADKASILKPTASSAPRITFDRAYQARHAGQATVWNASIGGGTAPYRVSIVWGDGATETLARTDGASFGLSHTYTDDSSKNYLVTVTTTDARNAESKVQVVAAINVLLTNTASVLKGSNALSSFAAAVRERLWLIWPAYIVVVLMAIGYYLGEREEYRRLALAKRPVRAGGRGKR